MIFIYSASFIRIYSDYCLASRRTVSIWTDLERRECMAFQRKQASEKQGLQHYTSPLVWPSHCSALGCTCLENEDPRKRKP